MIRFAAAALLLLAMTFGIAAPAAAQPNIMTPFNAPGTVDTNAKRVEGIPFGDGERFKLDLYLPDPPALGAPVVMFIYGGGWKNGNRGDYEFVGRALASRGFIAVVPDYRLYPEVRYPDFLYDGARAAKWVEDNIASYGGDPQRFFLAGHSAGAYNAVMLALDKSFFRELGVTLPVRAVAGISGPYDFYPFEYDEVRNSFGDAPNPEGTQPVNLVTADAPPMLLLQGVTDFIVRVQNTEHLAERLRSQNVWVTEKYFENIGHMEPVFAMGALWRWRLPVLEEVTQFFARFGAFPSGAPRPNYIPDPPQTFDIAGGGTPQPIDDVVRQMEDMFAPLSN